MQLSFHKFNESQREHAVLKKLREGEIVAQISDAGTPGISDPGMALVSILCTLLSLTHCIEFSRCLKIKEQKCGPHPLLSGHTNRTDLPTQLNLLFFLIIVQFSIYLLLFPHVKFCVMFICMALSYEWPALFKTKLFV